MCLSGICEYGRSATREAFQGNLIEAALSLAVLSAVNSLQKLAEWQLEGGRQSRQMAKTHLANAAFKIGDVNLVNSRMLRQVDLSPASSLSELPNSLAELEAYIRGHPNSIDLVEALYLADALFAPDQMRRLVERLALCVVCT